MLTSQLSLTVSDNKSMLVTDISRYLYYFQVFYNAAEQLSDISNEKYLKENLELDARFLRRIREFVGDEIVAARMFNIAPNSRQLQISEIQKSSPLKITFIGCTVALVAAAVFSGGEISIDANRVSVEAKVNSLGQGIGDLKEGISTSKGNKYVIADEGISGKSRSPKNGDSDSGMLSDF